MRILFVSQMSPYLPCRDGFRVIPANLLKQFAGKHDIQLVALTDGMESNEERCWPNHLCRSVDLLPRVGELSLIRRRRQPPSTPLETLVVQRINQFRPDVLHVEGAALAPIGRLAPVGIVRLLSAHDSLELRFRDLARWGVFRTKLRSRVLAHVAKRFEKRWYHIYNRVVVTAEADRVAITSGLAPTPVAVVPNGVDLEFFHFRPQPVRGHLLFSGNMSWPPNEDAACYFASKIFPRIRSHHDDVHFSIVGADPSQRVLALREIPGVSVTGRVDDLRPWIWGAEVYVSPLRFGAGVKNKILEAMALGAPVVGTKESFTGTPVVDGQQARVAVDAVHFADIVLGLLRNSDESRRLASAARKLVEDHYTWQSVAEKFESYYVG